MNDLDLLRGSENSAISKSAILMFKCKKLANQTFPHGNSRQSAMFLKSLDTLYLHVFEKKRIVHQIIKAGTKVVHFDWRGRNRKEEACIRWHSCRGPISKLF